MMDRLNLPDFAAKIINRDGKYFIFDQTRKKYVALTPEEWVRQHFVNYLITEKGFPAEIIANEIAIKLNNTTKRCDTIVYNAFLEPFIIIEYKATTVDITEDVFGQIMRYNMVLHADYLIVSNGIKHICCKIDYSNKKYEFLREIPAYGEISKP